MMYSQTRKKSLGETECALERDADQIRENRRNILTVEEIKSKDLSDLPEGIRTAVIHSLKQIIIMNLAAAQQHEARQMSIEIYQGMLAFGKHTFQEREAMIVQEWTELKKNTHTSHSAFFGEVLPSFLRLLEQYIDAGFASTATAVAQLVKNGGEEIDSDVLSMSRSMGVKTDKKDRLTGSTEFSAADFAPIAKPAENQNQLIHSTQPTLLATEPAPAPSFAAPIQPRPNTLAQSQFSYFASERKERKSLSKSQIGGIILGQGDDALDLRTVSTHPSSLLLQRQPAPSPASHSTSSTAQAPSFYHPAPVQSLGKSETVSHPANPGA